MTSPRQIDSPLPGATGRDERIEPDDPPIDISVVIPALDEQATIGACLRSLADQDFDGRVEIIVVDNGSRDATAEIARAHGARVIGEGQRGVCHARQTGTAAARGVVVVSTDADTVFPADWLARIAATLAAAPDAVATCGPCRFVDGPRWGSVYTGVVFGVTGWLHRRTGRVLYASATNIAFRRSAWPGYDTTLTQGGDELGLLRDLRPQGRVHFDPDRVTLTSARRLQRGLVYNLLVTCLFFYLTAYWLNRLAHRTVVGGAPLIRDDAPAAPVSSGGALSVARQHREVAVCLSAVAALAIAWWLVPFDVV